MNKQINKQNFFRINGVLTKNMGNTMWSSRFYSSNLTNNIGDLFIGPSRRSKKMWSRDHTILSSWIGSKVKVHNGRQVFSILITPEMCGYKLGEFVYTRSEQRTKKKKSKKK